MKNNSNSSLREDLNQLKYSMRITVEENMPESVNRAVLLDRLDAEVALSDVDLVQQGITTKDLSGAPSIVGTVQYFLIACANYRADLPEMARRHYQQAVYELGLVDGAAGRKRELAIRSNAARHQKTNLMRDELKKFWKQEIRPRRLSLKQEVNELANVAGDTFKYDTIVRIVKELRRDAAEGESGLT